MDKETRLRLICVGAGAVLGWLLIELVSYLGLGVGALGAVLGAAIGYLVDLRKLPFSS